VALARVDHSRSSTATSQSPATQAHHNDDQIKCERQARV
jgi:hypothetical protein